MMSKSVERRLTIQQSESDKIDELIEKLLATYLDMTIEIKKAYYFNAARAALRAKFDAQTAWIAVLEAQLKTENAALKEAHKKSADDVMNIIGDALSGYCDRYLNYDPSGKRYCKWGIVEKDIRSLFELPQSPEVER